MRARRHHSGRDGGTHQRGARHEIGARGHTNETGNYTFPNVTPDNYTVEITMDSFKTARRTGVTVSGGDRIGVPAITLEPAPSPKR